MSHRIGLGFDIHRFAAGRSLMLAGVLIPAERGLAGHSDADCPLHALADAILGALGAGDLGEHFPSSDPRWRDADSAALLEAVVRRMEDAGYRLGNADLTIVTEAPRLDEHKAMMRERLAEILNCSPSRVNVKAKSADGIGVVGAGEALAAAAIVLLESGDDAVGGGEALGLASG